MKNGNVYPRFDVFESTQSHARSLLLLICNQIIYHLHIQTVFSEGKIQGVKSQANQNNLGHTSQASLASSITPVCRQFRPCKNKRILIFGNQMKKRKVYDRQCSRVGKAVRRGGRWRLVEEMPGLLALPGRLSEPNRAVLA